jgi:mono/diheme cytochrome c family protein
MRRVLITIAVLAVLGAAGAATMVWLGMFNVAANEPHWPITHWVLEAARVRSIKASAAGIVAPASLGDERRAVSGTSHFAAHCATCHAAPGVPADEFAEGMYPTPPVLTDAARIYTPGELFWILRHGIKMSGMPAWPDHSDDDLWDIIAFLERLPTMSEQDYGMLIMASMHAGGHHMHGGMQMDMGGGHSVAGQTSSAPDRPGQGPAPTEAAEGKK